MSIIGKIKVGGTTYDISYPVGSIYLSVTDTSPAELFGGTWERIQDRFLLAAGSTYGAGTTGGESTHTLTIDEIPSHSHTAGSFDGYKIKNDAFNTIAGDMMHNVISLHTGDNKYESGLSTHIKTNTTGGGQGHSNMPPYLSVYMWKRVS